MALLRRRAQTEIRVSPADDSFRVLRSNLLVTIADLENPAVVVTSALAGEGKTMVCTRLGVSMAQTGARVIVVDLDLRKPSAHSRLGITNEVGVTDVLRNKVPLGDALQYVDPADDGHGLYLLTAGPPVANATELLGSPRMHALLQSLAAKADIVLIDSPPVLPVADTLVIGRLAAGAVLVLQARKTPLPAVQRAKDALTQNHTRILGVAINRMRAEEGWEGRPGYGYSYLPLQGDTTARETATTGNGS